MPETHMLIGDLKKFNTVVGDSFQYSEFHENDDASMETESINDGMPSVILEAIKAKIAIEKIISICESVLWCLQG